MIGRLSGTLVSKAPPLMLIDVNGVGYEVEAPLSVFYDLPEDGQPVVIVTHMAVKDDAHTLYGFANDAERTVFRQLLKISGIGAKLALTVLSGASGDELARYIADNDTAALTRLPGIGKKTAERIVMELRDKLDGLPLDAGPAGGATGGVTPGSRRGGAASEASSALASLGFKPREIDAMIRQVATPDMAAEDIIREALRTTVSGKGR
jgi:Holliday junction DNA helicase RuvA